jgi:hypothetical protein
MMDCKFVVGQKVVCVADGWHSEDRLDPPLCRPVKGNIYTISRIERLWCGIVMVYLREVAADGHRWHHTGFRPLEDRPKEADTDISVFTKLLDPAKTTELV